MNGDQNVPSASFLRQIRIACQNAFSVEIAGHLVLPSTENIVIEINCGDATNILRVTLAHKRSESELEEDARWMSYLAANDVRVATPIRSVSGRYAEKFSFGQQDYFLALFQKASGRVLNEHEFDAKSLFNWGRYLAKMQAKNAFYTPGIPKRKCFEDQYFLSEELRRTDPEMSRETENLINTIKALDTNPENYGLVHGDLHRNNFCIENGELTAFDFDEGCYSWYINDILGALYYLVRPMVEPEERSARFGFALTHFMKGYRSLRNGSALDLSTIDLFVRYRHLHMFWIRQFSAMHGQIDPHGRSELQLYRQQLINGEEFIKIDPLVLRNLT